MDQLVGGIYLEQGLSIRSIGENNLVNILSIIFKSETIGTAKIMGFSFRYALKIKGFRNGILKILHGKGQIVAVCSSAIRRKGQISAAAGEGNVFQAGAALKNRRRQVSSPVFMKGHACQRAASPEHTSPNLLKHHVLKLSLIAVQVYGFKSCTACKGVIPNSQHINGHIKGGQTGAIIKRMVSNGLHIGVGLQINILYVDAVFKGPIADGGQAVPQCDGLHCRTVIERIISDSLKVFPHNQMNNASVSGKNTVLGSAVHILHCPVLIIAAYSRLYNPLIADIGHRDLGQPPFAGIDGLTEGGRIRIKAPRIGLNVKAGRSNTAPIIVSIVIAYIKVIRTACFRTIRSILNIRLVIIQKVSIAIYCGVASVGTVGVRKFIIHVHCVGYGKRISLQASHLRIAYDYGNLLNGAARNIHISKLEPPIPCGIYLIA